MMVVNLRQTMPRMLDEVRNGIADDTLLDMVKYHTTTAWAGISLSAQEQFGDYVVGVYGAHIVSAYKINSFVKHAEPDRLRFDVESAPEMAFMIGQQVPGGSWKRGEARPVRYVDTRAVIAHFDEKGLISDDGPTSDERMVAFVNSLAAPTPIPDGAATTLGQVDVVKDPRGGITVTVPMGTKVTVIQRPA